MVTVANLDITLVQRFASDNGVLWMGAGVSQARKLDATGRPLEPGVPGVGPLTNRFLERDLFADRWWEEDLLEAASRFVQRHGRAALDAILREWYAADGYAVSAPRFYALLSQLPPQVRRFATTNYDPFTERALALRDPVVVVRDRGAERVQGDRPAVFKVHGDALDPERCVITMGDYAQWEYTTPLLRGILTEMFTRDTVVMVGYRARDPHFVRLLTWVATAVRETGGAPHPVYVVIPGPKPEDFAIFDELRLDIVLVDATGDQFLEALLPALRMELDRRIAEQLQNVVDAEEVRAARSAVRDAERNVVTPDDWRRVSELRRALAGMLHRQHRWDESLTVRAYAVEDLRKGGAEADAAKKLTVLINEARQQHRILPLIVFRAQECMRNGVYDETDAAVRLSLFLAVGRLYASGGGEEEVLRIMERVGEVDVGDDFELEQARELVLHLLRAERAQVVEDYNDAADHWARAAAATHEPDLRIECEIRAGICTGLAGSTDLGIAKLHAVAPTAAMQFLHVSALGWLVALHGDVADAAEHFRSAARERIAALDIARASASLRNVSWAENQSTGFILQEDSGAAQATRLARAAAPEAQKVVPLSDILQEAHGALAFERIADARDPAYSAAGFSVAEADPASLERARGTLAELWLRAAALTPDSTELFLASRYTALTCAAGTTGREKSQLDQVVALLRAHATQETMQAILLDVTGRSVGRFERTGLLRFLRRIVDLVPPNLMELLVHVAVVGLRRDWSVNSRVEVRVAACELASAAARFLSPAQIGELRTEVLGLLPNTPAVRLDKVVELLARLLEAAPISQKEADAFAEPLLAKLQDGSEVFKESMRVALAILGPHTAPDVRDRIVCAIAPEDGPLDWTARSWLWRIDREPTTEDADRFFTEQASGLAERLKREEDPAQLFNSVFDLPLTHVAATLAPLAAPDVREVALGLALRMVHHPWALWVERASWANYASYLAAESKELKSEAVDVLARALRGDTPGNQIIREEETHPLSSFRVREATIAYLQSAAAIGLSRIHMGAELELRGRIEEDLLRASTRAAAAVRKSAIDELGLRLAADHITPGSRLMALESLVIGTTDPQADIRGTAYRALRRVMQSAQVSPEIQRSAREALESALALETSALAHQIALTAP